MNSSLRLLDWFHQNKRDLPFRKKKAAYEIWISEIMLQQTRVAAMLPLYQNFLIKFPTVDSLALASEEEVISAWQGLGYYSRARNLRKAAIYLVSNFNGKFPKQLEEVLKIPGIGPYTSRAILSIAYDMPYAVLDGNVKRVLSRFYLYEENIIGPKADRDLQKLANDFLNVESPGDHNQALMELGATICLPENPKCLICPLLGECQAQISGQTKRIPKRVKQTKQVNLLAEILCIICDQKILLIREKHTRFLKGMLSLPIVFLNESEDSEYRSSNVLMKLREFFEYTILPKRIKHTITHHKFDFKLRLVYITSNQWGNFEFSQSTECDWKWAEIDELTSLFPSSIAKKVKLELES